MSRGKVCVIGLTGQSAFLKTDHFPRPGETVSCASLFFEPGGKGHNQAVACARMGAETVFIGAVGEDANAEACRSALEREGIAACLIPKKEPTAFASITTDGTGENTVEVYTGAAGLLAPGDLAGNEIRKRVEDCAWFLLQNELSLECLEASLRLAASVGGRVILNPAPAENLTEAMLEQCDIITPNYGEAAALAGWPADRRPADEKLCACFSKRRNGDTLITLGGEGVWLIRNGVCRHMGAYSHGPVVDTTGAGDTFNGVLAAILAGGGTLEEAAGAAVIAAGISVTRRGAAGSIPTGTEVRNEMK